MTRQRNNIARLPYETRVEVSRMLFDGVPYAEIREAIAAADPAAPAIHNTSLMSWQKGQEYKQYTQARQGFDRRTEMQRMIAAVQNDGRGPESLADIVEFELLQQMVPLAIGIQDEPDQSDATNQAARLARAIKALKGARIAGDLAKRERRMQQLQDQLDAERAEFEAAEAELRNEIAALQAGGKKVDPSKVATELDRILGINRAPSPIGEGEGTDGK